MITTLLNKAANVEFTTAIEVVVPEPLAEFGTSPVLVFPDWGGVADSSSPFHMYCDA